MDLDERQRFDRLEGKIDRLLATLTHIIKQELHNMATTKDLLDGLKASQDAETAAVASYASAVTDAFTRLEAKIASGAAVTQADIDEAKSISDEAAANLAAISAGTNKAAGEGV